MAIVVSIEKEKIILGLDGGNTLEADKKDIQFEVSLGDEVEIYKAKDRNYFMPKKQRTTAQIEKQFTKGVVERKGKTYVSKLIYCLLAFFLGWCAAHKFYAQKKRSAIIRLCLFWTVIPMIISFIEFLIALAKTADIEGFIEV